MSILNGGLQAYGKLSACKGIQTKNAMLQSHRSCHTMASKVPRARRERASTTTEERYQKATAMIVSNPIKRKLRLILIETKVEVCKLSAGISEVFSTHCVVCVAIYFILVFILRPQLYSTALRNETEMHNT